MSPILFFTLSGHAVEICNKQIKIAQTHMLNKKRNKAAKALNIAIENKACKGKRSELQKTLSSYFNIFLTDEAQHNFEKAKSIYEKKTEESKDHLLIEIDKKEYNLQVVGLLQRIYFQQDSCDKSYKLGLAVEQISPYLSENKKKLFLSLLCLKNYKKAQKLKRYIPQSKDIYHRLYLIELNYGLKKITDAKKGLEEISQVAHPEVIKWKFLLEKNLRKKRRYALKYKETCHDPIYKIGKDYKALNRPCKNPKILKFIEDLNEK